jgi:hypothetical protein
MDDLTVVAAGIVRVVTAEERVITVALLLRAGREKQPGRSSRQRRVGKATSMRTSMHTPIAFRFSSFCVVLNCLAFLYSPNTSSSKK